MTQKQKLEPIFARQEQAVVYLFSRYWEEIPEFKGKKIRRIHVRFPDFSIVNAEGKEEAIEFEYGLSAFRSHLGGESLRNLYLDGVRRLYVIYWDKNDDENKLRGEIKRDGFTGKVEFVCLKNYFSACVIRNRETEPLQASWTFTKKRTVAPEAYSSEEITKAITKLGGAVESLDPDSELYRVMGFNKSGSDFIECDHWEKIHFFTTTARLHRDRLPCRLFMKPTGCNYFNGYFDIKGAFELRKGGQSVQQFFKEYYFYDYEHDVAKFDGKVTCFVCDFNQLEYEQGRDIYEFLKRANYSLGVQASIAIEEKGDIAKIDAIVAGKVGGGRLRNRERVARQ